MKISPKVLATTTCLGLLMSATAAFALGPAEEGRRVYMRENCYGCHGGRSGGGMGPQFRSERPDAGDISETLRKGEGGGMPAYPHLTAQDASDLSAYFRTLRTAAEPVFTHWWEPVPTR
jgi:mono/diheme cytochrome c family protein